MHFGGCIHGLCRPTVVIFITVVILLRDCMALKCAHCKPDIDPNIAETNTLMINGNYVADGSLSGRMNRQNYSDWPLCPEVEHPKSSGQIELECPPDSDGEVWVCGYAYAANELYATRSCVTKLKTFKMEVCYPKAVYDDEGEVECTFELSYCSTDMCNQKSPAQKRLCALKGKKPAGSGASAVGQITLVQAFLLVVAVLVTT